MLDTKGRVGSPERAHREQYGPDRGEYRVNMFRLEQWVRRAVSAAEFDLIITGVSFYYEPRGTDEAYIAPWIQGKAMPEKICGMMNIVGYGTIEERSVRGQTRKQRVIHWDRTEEFYAKNQFRNGAGSVFPSGLSVNPTLPDVWEAISKGRAITPGRRTGGRPSTRGSDRS
jgi:hypothetical protein